MNVDYEFELSLLKLARELRQIHELDYLRLYEMLMDTDGEDLYRLEVINNDFLETLQDYKKQKLNDRLIIGAEKIEATTDPKEKARLMVHYNNLLKELGA